MYSDTNFPLKPRARLNLERFQKGNQNKSQLQKEAIFGHDKFQKQHIFASKMRILCIQAVPAKMRRLIAAT